MKQPIKYHIGIVLGDEVTNDNYREPVIYSILRGKGMEFEIVLYSLYNESFSPAVESAVNRANEYFETERVTSVLCSTLPCSGEKAKQLNQKIIESSDFVIFYYEKKTREIEELKKYARNNFKYISDISSLR